jgi:hypothetical protein
MTIARATKGRRVEKLQRCRYGDGCCLRALCLDFADLSIVAADAIKERIRYKRRPLVKDSFLAMTNRDDIGAVSALHLCVQAAPLPDDGGTLLL